MRIIVMSDSHGNFRAVESIILRNSDAEIFIHLGDGEKDIDQFILKYPQFRDKIFHVAGNCDFNSLSPDRQKLFLIDHNLFATHGHIFGVHGGLDRLVEAAKEQGCDIVLYGHTHVRFNKYINGMYIMNPGSCSEPHDGTLPSFGTIDISPAGILTNIADV